MAFTTAGVRLDAPLAAETWEIKMSDLLNGGFVIIGAVIAAMAGWFAAKRAADAQIKALEKQSEEERARYQQSRHQKKYAMALAIRTEARRICHAVRERLPRAQVSSAGIGEMDISVYPLMRGEREDIGLLSDELQDEALQLTNRVDDYNSHIETRDKTGSKTHTKLDSEVSEKLEGMQTLANSQEQKLGEFIARV